MRGPISTWVDLLQARAEAHPERRLFTFLRDGDEEGESLSFGGLYERARRIAAALAARGAGEGERALLLYSPGLELIAAFLGCLCAGVVAVPAYPPRPGGRRRGPDPRLAAVARDCRPRWVLTETAIVGRRGELATEIPALAAAGWLASDGEELPPPGDWRRPELAPSDLAFLQYTSGSTSEPKGVRISHGNLLANQEAIRRAFGQSAESVVVGWLPLYHDMGLIGNVLQPLYAGARCVLMSPAAFLQKPRRWLAAVSRYRGTTSGGPDFAYDLCARRIRPEEREGLDLSSWRVAFNGAEPVRAATLERFADAFAPCGFSHRAFFPCYGLAEATLFVTGGEVEAEPAVERFEAAALEAHRAVPAGEGEGPRALVGCGGPAPGTELRIVDPETGRERAAGGVGEIWLAGPGVAEGYWDHPQATERDFRARLAGEPGAGPFLRTGDLGFLREGELFVTGRLKDLVILRGRNHYPQDLEATAGGAHPRLRAGGGAAFAVELEGREGLVVVHELERRRLSDLNLDLDLEEVAPAIRQAVAEEHEVQIDRVVLIEAGGLPRTTSGKVRRRTCRQSWQAEALPVLAESRFPAGGEEVGPAAPALAREDLLSLPPEDRVGWLAEALRRRLARLLARPPGQVDPARPLTALGVDSLSALELAGELEEELGTALSLPRLLSGASLEELSGELATALEGETEGGLGAGLEADGAGGTGEHPLSRGQRALWFLEQLTPTTTAFILVGAARVRGEIDPRALERALQAVVDRHPALRTTFRVEEGEPRQQVRSVMEVRLQVEDARGWSEARVACHLEEAAYRPFDLAQGPLLRLGWLGRGEREGVLWLALHHLVSDFWSIGLLLRELEALYRQETGGPPARLAPVERSYADYVGWQERMLASPRGEELWSFWRRRLAGELPALELPTDRPRPPAWSARGAFLPGRLPPVLVAELEALARRSGATLYALLLAAFQVLLARLAGQEELLLGSPTTGRGSAAWAGTCGYFINPLVHRADLGDDPPFSRHLERVRRGVLEALEHQDFPFPLLAERLQPERDPSRSPVFQVFFVMEQARILGERGLSAFALGDEGARLTLFDLSLESLRLGRRSSQFDLMLLLAPLDGGLALSLEYNPDLFDATTVGRFLGHYRTLLAGVAAGPERRVGELPLLTPAQRAQLLQERNARRPAVVSTPLLSPDDGCLHQLFAARARERPRATAVIHEVEELSYQRLEAEANRLARRLRRLGVGPEVPVGLCLPRSPELVVALLAVLKAGGAYVPLDPAYPPERLTFMLEDALGSSPAPLLVTRGDLLSELPLSELALPAGLRVLHLDRERKAIAGESPEPPADLTAPEHAAYVIYTSGSTGQPKGVVVPHRNVVRLLHATEGLFDFGPEEVWTLFHSYAFDFSVWELWGALAYGGSLVVVPWEVSRSPALFRELLVTEGVTVLSQTPSAFAQLVRLEEEEPAGGEMALRWVVFGGEALDFPSLAPWLARHGEERPRLVNLYGITETTVHATWRPVGRRDLEAGGSLIGEPLPDLALYLADRRLRLVPPGTPGEILLAGPGLARGYLGRPALTAGRFLPDPFSPAPGGRLYASGDLARFRHDGDLEYLGRLDHQVKIRGFRIEPGEIESALGRLAGVAQAVVTVRRPSPAADPRLVAYVVPRGPVPETGDLRRELGRTLPDPMLPAAFVFLDALPRTAGGKVDRRSLPEPGEARGEGEAAAPRTATEERLARIWEEVLEAREVGVHDSFFDLGGHSLLVTRLASRVRSELGVELPLARLFELPTLGAMAAELDRARPPGASVPAAPAIRPRPRREDEAPPARAPLSYAQERLWFLSRMAADPAAYDIFGAFELSGPLDARALEAALAEVVRRHESLRTTFPIDDGPGGEGQPCQQIAPPGERPLPVVDLSGLATAMGPRPAPGVSAVSAGGDPRDSPRGGDGGGRPGAGAQERSEHPTRRATASEREKARACLSERQRASSRAAWSEAGSAPVGSDPATAEAPGLPERSGGYRPPSGAPGTVQSAARELAAAESRFPFDLARGPLFRTQLLRLAGDEHLLLMNLHHVISDGWSLGVLMSELELLYQAYRRRRPSPLAEPALQYADYAVWQREHLTGETLDRLLAYWTGRFADGQQVLELPTDRPRPPVQTFRGAQRPWPLPPELAAGLERLGRGAGATRFMVLLAGLLVLLRRYTGVRDLTVGGLIANRNRAELEGLMGFFVNNLALRVDTGGVAGFGQLLERVREVTLAAYGHQDLPFEKLLAELELDRVRDRTPLFQVLLVVQNLPDPRPRLEDLQVGLVTAPRQRAEFDLTFWLEERGGLASSIEYNADLFDAATVERLRRHLETVLTAAAARPQEPLEALPLLTAAEAHQLLREWTDSGHRWPDARPVHRAFAGWAAAQPEAVAAVAAGETVTYGELAARVRRLAGALARAGAGPERVVALLAPRGIDLLSGLLATFQAGAAYLPLDPRHPAARIRQVLAESRAGLVAVSPELLPLAREAAGEPAAGEPAGGVRPRLLDLSEALATADREVEEAAEVDPRQLAYVLFTSGSTGRPKGAMVSWRGFVNHLASKIADLGITAADAVAQTANQCFDISIWQLLAPLQAGARVHLLSDEVVLDPARLLAAVEEEAISLLELVPTQMEELLEEVRRRDAGSRGPGDVAPRRVRLAALRWLVPTGEALPPPLAGRWLEAFPHLALLNAYGPTECADDVTVHPLRQPPPPGTLRVPIGRPVPNLRPHVVDRHLRPLPAGVAGELCLGGVGVGRGYLDDPRRTAVLFLPDPFAGRAGERLYKSGDLARQLHDGRFDFLGRVDFQVKVRGFRIELGEIETVLAGHPAVRQAVVTARSDRLVAYVVPAGEPAPAASELRDHLARRLPEYMVPSAFMFLAALPLTASGKVDRKALPDPGDERPELERPCVAPRSPVEEVLAGIWCECLELARVGVEDDFFELGGYSVMVTRVLARVRARLGVEIPLPAFFEHPTVAELARWVERGGGSALPPLEPVPRDRDLPLSYAQERLWFHTQLAPESTSYHVPRTLRLTGDPDAGALEEAYRALIRRHEMLRTTFHSTAEGAVQRVHPDMPFSLARLDLRRLAHDDRERELRRRMAAYGNRPFDFARGPFLRAELVHLGEKRWALIQSEHHLVHDGWTEGVLVRDMLELYRAGVEGRAPELPELPVQFADFAVWQRK